jgi:hypothetical protein
MVGTSTVVMVGSNKYTDELMILNDREFRFQDQHYAIINKYENDCSYKSETQLFPERFNFGPFENVHIVYFNCSSLYKCNDNQIRCGFRYWYFLLLLIVLALALLACSTVLVVCLRWLSRR